VKNLYGHFLGAMLLACSVQIATADELMEPPVFASDYHNKTLDLLMIAKPASIDAIPNVTGWVYEYCERQFSIGDSCIAGKSNLNPYGGARLQLNQGDTLKIHLVNKLPPITGFTDITDPGEQFLLQNPTNIHTHGMLVSPDYPANANTNPKFGDSIFVLTFNPNNGAPDITTATHIHGDISTGVTDYQYTIPAHHPSGLFWVHPHAHGISLNQVTAGMAGIITVGQVSDYVNGLPNEAGIRHLILKDVQVNSDNSLNQEYDPAFCDLPSTAAGVCNSSSGGQWYFTVNGQKNPQITVKPQGEIWRVTNASGSATYELQLTEKTDGDNAAIPMQLLSVDGISVTPASGISMSALKQIGGAKFQPVACPGSKSFSPEAICISSLHMMPGARAEVWVVNRDDDGEIDATQPTKAVFQTKGYSTGFGGDNWPAVDLAQVSFQKADKTVNTQVYLNNTSAVNFQSIANDLSSFNSKVGNLNNCQPLPKGWKRRIYYGYPTPANFGLGLELIDDKGQTVPGSFQDVTAFTGGAPSVCVPLPDPNTPVSERWELVNLTAEDHNFHIHQTKFRVLTKDELTGSADSPSTRILQDSVPVLTGSANCDGTIATWKAGNCQTTPVTVEIPFAIAGDFVYHCHILEHEDGGMMSVIHVTGSKQSNSDPIYHQH
jgi:FtsP/CotA-like multicopper oxidase with cupredoxin domain